MTNALQILGYYALAIAFLGLLGNITIFVVSFKSKSNSMFVLFCFLSLNDALSLYFWNLNHFVYSSFNLDLQNFNIYSCKIGSWIQFSSLQSSAWILVNPKKLKNKEDIFIAAIVPFYSIPCVSFSKFDRDRYQSIPLPARGCRCRSGLVLVPVIVLLPV